MAEAELPPRAIAQHSELLWVSAASFTEIDARGVQESQNRCSWASGELCERGQTKAWGDAWWVPG